MLSRGSGCRRPRQRVCKVPLRRCLPSTPDANGAGRHVRCWMIRGGPRGYWRPGGVPAVRGPPHAAARPAAPRAAGRPPRRGPADGLRGVVPGRRGRHRLPHRPARRGRRGVRVPDPRPGAAVDAAGGGGAPLPEAPGQEAQAARQGLKGWPARVPGYGSAAAPTLVRPGGGAPRRRPERREPVAASVLSSSRCESGDPLHRPTAAQSTADQLRLLYGTRRNAAEQPEFVGGRRGRHPQLGQRRA